MKTQSGFTLVELMVFLAVAITVVAIGVPALVSLHSINQMAGYSNDLVGGIRLARSEAIKRAGTVTICAKHSTNTTCSSDDWFNGWIVFVDDDGDGVHDGGEDVLRVWTIPTDERSNLTFQAAAPNAIRFDSSGGNAANAQVQFAFKKNDCQQNQARQITVSIMGRPSLAHVGCF